MDVVGSSFDAGGCFEYCSHVEALVTAGAWVVDTLGKVGMLRLKYVVERRRGCPSDEESGRQILQRLMLLAETEEYHARHCRMGEVLRDSFQRT